MAIVVVGALVLLLLRFMATEHDIADPKSLSALEASAKTRLKNNDGLIPCDANRGDLRVDAALREAGIEPPRVMIVVVPSFSPMLAIGLHDDHIRRFRFDESESVSAAVPPAGNTINVTEWAPIRLDRADADRLTAGVMRNTRYAMAKATSGTKDGTRYWFWDGADRCAYALSPEPGTLAHQVTQIVDVVTAETTTAAAIMDAVDTLEQFESTDRRQRSAMPSNDTPDS